MIAFYILHVHHYLGFGRSKSQHSMLIIGPMQRISWQHIFHIRVFFSVIYSLTRMFSDPSPLLTDEIILARSKGFNLQTMIHSHLMQKLCSALGPLEKKLACRLRSKHFIRLGPKTWVLSPQQLLVLSSIKDQFQNINQTSTQNLDQIPASNPESHFSLKISIKDLIGAYQHCPSKTII